MKQSLKYIHQSKGWAIDVSEAPWDSKIYGFPVVAVNSFTVSEVDDVNSEVKHFQAWLHEHRVGLVSARLSHESLRESMVLESMGFRFIEMVLHPTKNALQSTHYPDDSLKIAKAQAEDLTAIQSMAQRAFGYERLHMDPRLERSKGNIRYGNWVVNAFEHQSQRLIKISDGDRLLAFFIIEADEQKNIYWHLTAVEPELQGQGYGRRVWQAMLKNHQIAGFESVTTTIAARNTPILNLYSHLKFSFNPPEMTFHYLVDSRMRHAFV